jgi:hypothetical protein
MSKINPQQTYSQLVDMYLQFPKIQTVSGKLSWSHYCEIQEVEG